MDLLEDSVIGPLYKTRLERPAATPDPKTEGPWKDAAKWLDRSAEKVLIGPLPISVSRINQWVSCFTLGIWLALFSHSLPPFYWTSNMRHWISDVSGRHVIVGLGTAVAAAAMFFAGRTHQGDHGPVMRTRKTLISGRS